MIDCRELHNFKYINEYELEDGDDTEVLIEDENGDFYEVKCLSIDNGKLVLKMGEFIE